MSSKILKRTMVDLSIIIVSYNTKKLLKDCIASIEESTNNINYRVVVVDNASSDGSAELVKRLEKRNSRIELITNNENNGFGKANNQGIKKVKAKYYLLLNSDTVIKGTILKEMISWLDKHEKVAVVSCALKDTGGRLQGNGGYFPYLTKVFSWMFFIEDIPVLDKFIKPFHPRNPQSQFLKSDGLYKQATKFDWVTGAYFLIRKEVIKEIGLMDEDYFMYVEEVDWCYRISKLGWEIWYLPKWSILHLGGASSTAEFPILSEYKGLKTFYKKHMPAWKYPILRLFLKMGALLRLIILGLLKGGNARETYTKAFKIA